MFLRLIIILISFSNKRVIIFATFYIMFIINTIAQDIECVCLIDFIYRKIMCIDSIVSV